MGSVVLGRRLVNLPIINRGVSGQRTALGFPLCGTLSVPEPSGFRWPDHASDSFPRLRVGQKYHRSLSTSFFGEKLRSSLFENIQLQGAASQHGLASRSPRQPWRGLVVQSNGALQWPDDPGWPLGDTEMRRRKRYGEHVEKKKKEAKKRRKAASKGIPVPPVHAPANGMLLPALIPVAHRTLAARAAVREGVERLLQALPAFACSSCPEVYVGPAGHEVRTCTGKDMHTRRGHHLWMKATAEDVVGEVESFHLADRIYTLVQHDHRHSTPRIPAVVELCIQAGVDLPQYPTLRRSKPFGREPMEDKKAEGMGAERGRGGASESREGPGEGGGVQMRVGRPGRDLTMEERLREEVWQREVGSGGAQEDADTAGERSGNGVGQARDEARHRLGVVPGSAERDTLSGQAGFGNVGRAGEGGVVTAGSQGEAGSAPVGQTSRPLTVLASVSGSERVEMGQSLEGPGLRATSRANGKAEKRDEGGLGFPLEAGGGLDQSEGGDLRSWEKPWQDGTRLPPLSEDPDLKRVAERTLAAWSVLREGVAKLMSKYPVMSCGYCPEVHVGPRGHKVRLCDAAKHQWRHGLHGWQDAILDDVVPPKYVWHIRDGQPHVHELRAFYGMAPAVVELCVQAGATAPRGFRANMREDVAIPDIEELKRVL